MKKIPIALALILCACTKYDLRKENEVVNDKEKPASCSFGITQFNLEKRAFLQSSNLRVRPNSTGSVTTPNAVILLDFDGQLVSGTSWNTSGDINCAPANLTLDQMTSIYNRVTEDYRPFNVLVTTDEAVYNACNPYKRQRVVVTETWEWYGQSGGTSYIGSFTWGDNTPAFVFSSLLGYNEKSIGEACSHEAGHTLGLRHQAFYIDCTFNSEYNAGTGTGITSWAPIMGNSYYKNITTWHNGPTAYGCSSLQDDISIISGTLGFITDDYQNTTGNGAATLSSSLTGVINNNTDVDVFYVNTTSPVTVTADPYNLGNGDGANMDLVLKVYDSRGKLLQTYNDPNLLSASISLTAGKYYVSVEAVATDYAAKYGMLGQYTISLQ